MYIQKEVKISPVLGREGRHLGKKCIYNAWYASGQYHS